MALGNKLCSECIKEEMGQSNPNRLRFHTCGRQVIVMQRVDGHTWTIGEQTVLTGKKQERYREDVCAICQCKRTMDMWFDVPQPILFERSGITFVPERMPKCVEGLPFPKLQDRYKSL